MIDASLPTYRPRVRRMDAIDGFGVPVALSGPDNGRVAIIFDEVPSEKGDYDIVRQRLHVAMIRTVVISPIEGLSAKSVAGVLDQLKVPGGLLVSDQAAGDLAWTVAATQRERFTGLVVIDCGHPRVPDVNGVIRDKHCPAVQVDTTVLASTRATQAVARASRRYVHGEFRLAELAGPRRSRHFTTQLVAEIVMRSLSR